jgi:hypothetical protein
MQQVVSETVSQRLTAVCGGRAAMGRLLVAA